MWMGKLYDSYSTQEKAHGREGAVHVRAESIVLRYYISSAKLTAKELLEATRAHWSIENQLHWRLDVGMREDECQIVRGEAGENLAVCRHIAMNLLTADKTFKAGIKRKQKRAGRNNEYLSQILTAAGLHDFALASDIS